MRLPFSFSIIYIVSVLLLIILLTSENIQETDAIYPYAIKGFVADIRHTPGLLIGGWALKKALKLKKLKILIALKIKLKLKLLVKKLLFKKFKFWFGRKRRSAGPVPVIEDHEIELPEGMYPDVQENDIIPYYMMATEFDQQGCLPKSICDVMARNRTLSDYYNGNGGGGGDDDDGEVPNAMTTFERMITEDYKDIDRPEDTTSPSFVYEYAAYYGKTSKSESACASLFSTCNESSKKLNKIMDGSYKTDICDGPDEVEYYGSPTHQQQQLLHHQKQSAKQAHQHYDSPYYHSPQDHQLYESFLQQQQSNSKLKFE